MYRANDLEVCWTLVVPFDKAKLGKGLLRSFFELRSTAGTGTDVEKEQRSKGDGQSKTH